MGKIAANSTKLSALLLLSTSLCYGWPQPRRAPVPGSRGARQEQRQEQREQRQEQRQAQPNSSQNAPHFGSQRLMGPGPHAGDWLRRSHDMPPDQQEKMLESDPQFKNLPADKQQQLRQRLQMFNSLTPDQQQRILDRMEIREHLTPEQKEQEKDLFGRYMTLPEQRRLAVHGALRELTALSPQERQQRLASPEYRSRFSDQEREILTQALQFGTPPSRMRPNAQPPQ